MTEDEIEVEAISGLMAMACSLDGFGHAGIVVVQETMTGEYRTMSPAALLDQLRPGWRQRDPPRSSLCAVHARWEQIPNKGAFRICVSCGHVYAQRAHLAAEWNFKFGNTRSAANAHTIDICPSCGRYLLI